MFIFGIILFIFAVIVIVTAIIYDILIEEVFIFAFIITLIGFFLIGISYFTNFNYIKSPKKEIPLSIYHNNNIYYIYKDSLITENGEDEVRDGKWKEAYIELLTSKEVVDCINNPVNDSIIYRLVPTTSVGNNSWIPLNQAEFPEEWSLAKKGDTLIILDVKDGVPEIGFFNYKNR